MKQIRLKIKSVTIHEFLNPYMAQRCHIWKWVYIIYECFYSYMKTTHSIYGTYLHVCYIYVTYMFLFFMGYFNKRGVETDSPTPYLHNKGRFLKYVQKPPQALNSVLINLANLRYFNKNRGRNWFPHTTIPTHTMRVDLKNMYKIHHIAFKIDHFGHPAIF